MAHNHADSAGCGHWSGVLHQKSHDDAGSRRRTEHTQRVLDEARQQASDIEIKAKNQALEIRQAAETEVSRRRNELTREEDRLQKRREELDMRTDRLEKREQALNKRQGLVDKRANEIDKLHETNRRDLQRISQMSPEEAPERIAG